MNEPNNSPIGPMIIKPVIKPIDAPMRPPLEPPSFFTPTIGITQSIKEIIIAIIKVIVRNCKLNSTASVKFSSNKPNQDVIGPGIIGTKLPIIPIYQNNTK